MHEQGINSARGGLGYKVGYMTAGTGQVGSHLQLVNGHNTDRKTLCISASKTLKLFSQVKYSRTGVSQLSAITGNKQTQIIIDKSDSYSHALRPTSWTMRSCSVHDCLLVQYVMENPSCRCYFWCCWCSRS